MKAANGNPQPMGASARLYALSAGLAGVSFYVSALVDWTCSAPAAFGAMLIAAALSGLVKVPIPGVSGSFSASYMIVLFAVVHSSPGEALSVAVAAIGTQCVWRPATRIGWYHVWFNAGAICLATGASHFAFHSAMLPGWASSNAIRLLLASACYFAVNTGLTAGAIARDESRAWFPVWRSTYAWSFPYYLLSATIVAVFEWVRGSFGLEVALLGAPAIYVVFASYRLQVEKLERERRRADELRAHAEEVSALHLRTIQALALAIEAKDDTTHDHLQRVQVYAIEIGTELGLSQDELKALEAASFLHDIGKLAVPDYIISKPGKLTQEEFEKMKIHPVVGAEILESVAFPYPVVPIVRAHHEKWDGTGYPYGLKGEEIPIGARILSAVDCLDALASHRQYRPAMPVEKAMGIVLSESGKSYDPKVVEVLNRRFVELEGKAKAAIPHDESAAKLSKEIKISRGDAPAAGFQESSKKSQLAMVRHEAPVVEEMTDQLAKALTPDKVFEAVESGLRQLIPFDCIAFYLRTNDLLLPAYVQGQDAALFSTLRIPMGQGLAGWVGENKKALFNGNPAVEPGYLNDPSKYTMLRAAAAIPLLHDETTIGVLALYSAEKDGFHSEHMRVLQTTGPRVAVALYNARQFEAARQTSQIDAVTGLPNSAALFQTFDAEIARARRGNEVLAVLAADLNQFRRINDRFGRETGDRILRQTGAVIRASCREYDLVARSGDDTFILVLPGCAADSVAARVDALAAGVAQLAQSEFAAEAGLLSLEVGHACYPADGTDPEALLAAADTRLHIAKASRVTGGMAGLARATLEQGASFPVRPGT